MGKLTRKTNIDPMIELRALWRMSVKDTPVLGDDWVNRTMARVVTVSMPESSKFFDIFWVGALSASLSILALSFIYRNHSTDLASMLIASKSVISVGSLQ